MTLLLIYLAIALGFSFYCSIAEAVLLSITPSFIATLREKKPKDAERLFSLKSNIDRPLAAILSLNTIAHTVGAAGVGAQAGIAMKSVPLAVVSAVLTLLILVFSEIIPKTIGALYWRGLSPWVGRSVQWLILLMYPLVWLSEQLTRFLAGGHKPHALTRDELGAMAEIGAQQGVLQESESKVFRSLMRFPKIKVTDVMTPRSVIVGFDQSMTVAELFEGFPKLPTSRIPIYKERLDQVVGFVLKVDLLLAKTEDQGDRPLADFRRDILIVPAESSLTKVLEQLLRDGHHIAMVMDQYGSVVGLVTLEDIVETLLGLEIVDEHDEQVDMQKFARDRWRERAGKIGLNVNQAE